MNRQRPRYIALRLPLSACMAMMICSTACTGHVQSDGDTVDDGRGATGQGGKSGEGAVGAGGQGGASTFGPLPLPLRLLTRVEYNNTVADLLADTSAPASAFPAEDATTTGFADVPKLDDVNVNAYMKAAEALAARAMVASPPLLACALEGAQEGECVRSFVASFGRRAYRRPLNDAEVQSHVALYNETFKSTLKLTSAEAFQALLTAMLQSPFFLYRWENAWVVKPARQAIALSPHHLASQLSYFLWSSMPDAALFSAADADELKTPTQVEKQVRRLLADPRADKAIGSFAEQWMGVTNLSGALRGKAGWTPVLAVAMVQEIKRFAVDTILRGDGSLETLLTSRNTRVDATMAAFYGEKSITGTDVKPLTFATNERAGLLTLAGVMAAHADENEPSPILRGKFIRERIMCDLIPPPPGGVPDLPAPDPNTSKRERFAMHAQGGCKGCHSLMDPIGFGFESFDNVGAFRTMDGKFAVDAKGAVSGLDGDEVAFSSATDLVTKLAHSRQVAECLTKQLLRFGLHRKEGDPDSAALNDVATAVTKSKSNIREMLVSLATSTLFTHRALSTEESLP